MLKVNDIAPEFSLPDQNGKVHNLSDYKGKKVLLYFYPKDNTPGCTREACEFRDNYKGLSETGLVVLGMSADSVKSHEKFSQKFDLPFPILSDESKETLKAYGVWGEKKFMGRTYDGINRVSFLIDENGKIAKLYDKVKVDDHAKEVGEDVR